MKKLLFPAFASALAFVLVTVVFQMNFALTAVGQDIKDNSNTLLEENSRQSSEIISRPAKMKSLRQFVKKNFAGKFDEGTLLETIAEGKPAITFSFTQGERTIESILIDRGNDLELHSDDYPTAWKYKVETEALTNFSEKVPVENLDSLLSSQSKTCSGLTTFGNPYPCCSVNGIAGYGNCTYAAWYHMYRFWGVSPGSWGNASTWIENARRAGYPTSATPALYAVGVNSTLGRGYCGRFPCGHVVWVMEIENSFVWVLEQSCGSTQQGIQQKRYSISTFNKGFILSPVSAPSPQIFGHSPNLQIWASSNTQAIRFNTQSVNPGARAVVINPSGGRFTLKDSQLYHSNYPTQSLTAYTVLNIPGWWNIQIFNENGKYSSQYWFYVN